MSKYVKAYTKAIRKTRDKKYHTYKEDVLQAVLGLSAEAGEVADLMEKSIRASEWATPFIASMCRELGDVLYYVLAIANSYELDLDDLIIMNISKLIDRGDMPEGVLDDADKEE